MQVIETMLGRLGSRFTLHFLPREKLVRLSPLGKYYDLPWHLTLGFRVGDTLRVLPFAGSEAEADFFPEIEMELTMTSVTFRARDRQLGLWAAFKFTAPFYPQDEQLSTAPFFYLDVTLEALPTDKPLEFVAGLKLAEGTARTTHLTALPSQFVGGTLEADFRQLKSHWGPYPAPDSLSEKVFTAPLFLGLYDWPTEIWAEPVLHNDKISFDEKAKNYWQKLLAPSDSIGIIAEAEAGQLQPGDHFKLLMASCVNEPILEVKGLPHFFKYTKNYPEIWSVLEVVQNERKYIEKTNFFDKLVLDASPGRAKADFIAFTFQSYITNTWWTKPQSLDPADDWYSVWEGNCTFHSTVDVEYNLAWFYLLLWPELLEKTLAEWRGYFQQDERGEWMSHDIGGLLGANRQVYPHQMEVEENCNFILLTYALWRLTGREAVRRDNLDAVARLIRFVLDSDTTGNGFPDRGTANTVDDASPAVQFGREQTYLAVKALAACWATKMLITSSKFQVPSPEVEVSISESSNLEAGTLNLELETRIKLIGRTLDEQAWLGDHFAVTLDRDTAGLINPWSGQPLPPGELVGWDAYSLYTGNGLLYLLATDTEKGTNLPPLDYERFRRDLVETVLRSLTEYGCTHSSSDKSHIWVSQNLHRDFVAAYLGEDLSELSERYWAFEQFENGPTGRGGCFVDTYGGNHLRYYPRGITSLGLLHALAGARLDRVAGRLSLKPVRVPLRLPLLPLADWSAGRVPWLNFRLQAGKVVLEIENEDLLAGLTVELEA